jgi:hypothetical protein
MGAEQKTWNFYAVAVVVAVAVAVAVQHGSSSRRTGEVGVVSATGCTVSIT